MLGVEQRGASKVTRAEGHVLRLATSVLQEQRSVAMEKGVVVLGQSKRDCLTYCHTLQKEVRGAS